MPKEPPSPNWFDSSAERIICPHCKTGRAAVVRRIPDPTAQTLNCEPTVVRAATP